MIFRNFHYIFLVVLITLSAFARKFENPPISKEICIGNNCRTIEVTNKYRENVPDKDIIEEDFHTIREKNNKYGLTIRKVNDNTIMIDGYHDSFFKPKKEYIYEDLDTIKLKFRFPEDLKKDELSALDKLTGNINAQEHIDKRDRILTYTVNVWKMTTSPQLMNFDLFTKLGLFAMDYKSVIQSENCRVESGQRPCLLFHENKLDYISVEDVSVHIYKPDGKTIYETRKFFSVHIQTMPEEKRSTKEYKKMLDLAKNMNSPFALIGTGKNELIWNQALKIDLLNELYNKNLDPKTFRDFAEKVSEIRFGFFYVQPNSCAVRAVGQAVEWKILFNLPQGNGVGFFMCDTTGDGFANRIQKIGLRLGGIGYTGVAFQKHDPEKTKFKDFFQTKQAFELNLEGLNSYQDSQKVHDIFACDFSALKMKFYWGSKGFQLSSDYSGCHEDALGEEYFWRRKTDRDSVTLKNLNLTLVDFRPIYDLLSANIETLNFIEL
ncbi:MAG: hypothetical protein KDD58_08795 [Bdellovibrionales bacterium]|nr:hypothetical protein [Bdellovibrionales bacterium]